MAIAVVAKEATRPSGTARTTETASKRSGTTRPKGGLTPLQYPFEIKRMTADGGNNPATQNAIGPKR
jgi:hypothetical protein